MLVDSHCHLDFPDYQDELDVVVERARAVGVTTMLTICTHLSRFSQVRHIAAQFHNIYCTIGVHPHEVAKEGEVSAADLMAFTEDPKVIGIGETGLDYYYEHSPREAQKRSFRCHIAAARETGLPLIVHSRDAEDDTAHILRSEMAEGQFGGVMHCFSSRQSLALAAIDLGLYISISGIVTFKNAHELRSIVAEIPLDRLIIETDAPYLAPMPNRGKRNEPAFVVHTAERVAEIKGVSLQELARITSDNFFSLFAKAQRPDYAPS